jgi:chemotaxis protein MotB
MRINILLFLTCSLLFSSCIVTKKKYDDVLAQKIKTEGELADKEKQLDKANESIASLNETLNKLKQDTADLNQSYRTTSKKLAALNDQYDELNSYYKNLLTNSGKLNRDMAQQQDQLLAIQESLERTHKLNDSLSNSLAEREKKVKELENILANKDRAVKDLKDRITNALLNFKESDLTVKVKKRKSLCFAR